MFGDSISKSASILVTGALVAVFAVATSATITYARDARTDSDRESLRAGTTSPTPVPPPPSPAPAPTPSPLSSGGITNVTSGAAGTGGNTGGHVETGDEEINVHAVNEGPTNSNSTITETTGSIQPPSPSSPEPEENCADPRSRDCADRGR